MSISENISEKIEAIHEERITIGNPSKPHPIADEVRTRAREAILGGADEWKMYVKLFAKTAQEMARLIPTDGTENDEKMNTARAYLAANGMCAPGTGDRLLDNVTNDLNLP